MINKYINNILDQTSKILGIQAGLIEGNGTVTATGKVSAVEENVSEIIEKCAESDAKIERMYNPCKDF